MTVSIRLRLFLILALATGAVWLSAVVWIETSTRAEVERVLDARLAEAATMVSSLISDHRIALGQDGLATVPIPMGRAEGYSRQLSCQIWSLDDGGLVGRSDGAPDEQLTAADAEGYSRSVVAGEPWRVFTVINPDLGVRVMVGDSLAVRDRLVRDVIEGLLLPAAVILPLLGALIWISVARGLAPLDRLAETLRARDPSDLSPLPEGPSPQEIRPVRRALNALFARVAAARDVERDFTTYAAHELKTPLAGVRTQAQVMRMAPDAATRDAALRAIETSVDRTDRLVRQLLELAEVDRETPSHTATDLPALVAETVAELDMLARSRAVSLDCDLPAERCTVALNPFLLRAALRNVIENAINASPRAGQVRVALRRGPDGLRFDISDDGPGIAPDQRAHMVERFVRGPSGSGSGLGLAIVASAVERLGGRLELGQRDSGGRHVVSLILPG
ncbi:ATP-binding protein [Salipiger sp. P9]|uniref:ATP-binding protein n=1 Tax=Salipiger pentaromativorans TaxID=2943193 RepID=UPI002157713A|nr:ATP-binding protein [Salipiger pentaromativorans]MCR8547825.1 ATP-binding protein [Salipiger pentaromativorans]